MFGIGGPEVLVVFVLVLLIFGPKRLPELGRSLGKALGMFREATKDVRRGMSDVQSEFQHEMQDIKIREKDLKSAVLKDLTEEHREINKNQSPTCEDDNFGPIAPADSSGSDSSEEPPVG